MTREIILSCDITATVAEVARALIRSGLTDDSELERIAATRAAPVTVLGRSEGRASWVMLDPASPIARSGLQSGWIIRAAREDGPESSTPRLIPAVGTVEVCDGPQRGTKYSLVAGLNSMGRDPRSRILLEEASVSRCHASLEVGERALLRDLGSVNGTAVEGAEVEVSASEATVLDGSGANDAEVTVGTVRLRVRLTGVPAPPVCETPASVHPHTRAPLLAPRFPATERVLPTPPVPTPPGRLPMLAMLAPAMLGVVMYTVTGSAISLVMIAFTPLMMIGSWLDGRVTGRRAFRRDGGIFDAAVRAERTALLNLRDREIAARASESPGITEIAAAIEARGPLLWARRPEHRAFLELRLGEGAMRSRTKIVMPERGQSRPEHWSILQRLASDFEAVGPVPVLERLERSGSIGIAGEQMWAEGCARSLVLQLVGLHSPAEMVLACFAGPRQLVGGSSDWGWLSWLPHVDPPAGPLRAWSLAGDEPTASALLADLEAVRASRAAGRLSRPTVRSHLDPGGSSDPSATVTELPVTPAILVVVLDTGEIDPARLIALAEAGPDVGIHLLWVTARSAEVPAACRTLIDIDRGEAQVQITRSGESIRLSRLEFLDEPRARALARSLAPVVDTAIRPLDESDLPPTLALREVHPANLLGGDAPILASWRASGSLKGDWLAGERREPIRISAVIGQGIDGPIELDLRAQGPHALVGGTTGSGKSEFLQTWIMSLAARVSPDCVSFLLVDYKGGAAFAECARLPHTVGLVTDLDPHLARRALASLRAELRRREELLASRGAKDLLTLERQSDPATPPALLIVVDEFATLVKDVPEFVEGVVDIAQRGRSLGLHLILATQRPAGVITENLRANTNLRIALRMADAADSSDVIGVSDAASFDPAHPGRGAYRVGSGRIEHFQSGYLGGHSAQTNDPGIEIHPLGFFRAEPWPLPPEPVRSKPARDQTRDIVLLLEGIAEAAITARIDPPRRPWLDPLAKIIDRAALPTVLTNEDASGRGDSPAIGVADLPQQQRHSAFLLNLERLGNVALVGASGTGKSSALLTIAATLAELSAQGPAHVYAIDAAGGALEALRALPTVGAVASLSDAELVDRILRHVSGIVAERGVKFAEARANSLSSFRETIGGAAEPRIVLMIDGFSAFRATSEELGARDSRLSQLAEIMHSGRSLGVHVVVSADRPTALPSALAASVQEHLVFRLAGAFDYAHLGVPAEVLTDAPAGRVVLASSMVEVQIALLNGRQDLGGQAQAIESLAASLRSHDVRRATRLYNTPEQVPLHSLPMEVANRAVIGIESQNFTPVGIPSTGLAVVSGPPGSGLTTALHTCVNALRRRALAGGERMRRILLSLDASSRLLAESWDHVAIGPEEVATLARVLAEELGGRSASEPAETRTSHTVIAVERATSAEGTEALSALVSLAQACRRADALLVVEFELGAAAGVWELLGVLKQARWGISLQPDESDSGTPFRHVQGRVRRGDFPPGRGFVIEAGRAIPVQLALGWGILED
ncbi:FtsK/SpoIIIE domain-containing protein [Leucobacter sp. W1153]|uniref:FtsK/SpoIIIE domain-containing protein n=1 Tax=Leucobacter sp. W1153 TaxID=3439064 RepID=UPI003F3EE2B0